MQHGESSRRTMGTVSDEFKSSESRADTTIPHKTGARTMRLVHSRRQPLDNPSINNSQPLTLSVTHLGAIDGVIDRRPRFFAAGWHCRMLCVFSREAKFLLFKAEAAAAVVAKQ